MSSQLTLPMSPRLGYRADNFFVHHGVRNMLDSVVSQIRADSFYLCSMHGKSLTGKTHLSIRLLDLLHESEQHPTLLEGKEVPERIDELTRLAQKGNRVVLIDDADEYLASLHPGMSGPFVSLVEALRVSRGSLILLGDFESTEFPYDEHVASRIKAGDRVDIGTPAEEELDQIISLIAKQRGVFLTPKKRAYLEKRVGRDLASIVEYFDRVESLTRVLGKSAKFDVLSDAL